MIDFPQMVSVSHRNAQMYFDRDVECIFKFFRKRFNTNFEEDDVNSSRSEADGRLSFSSIAREAGSLDKELAASGFTQKDQNDIQRFLEGESEKDGDSESDNEGSESDNEGMADGRQIAALHELNTDAIDSLTLSDQMLPEQIPEFADQSSHEAPLSSEPDALNRDDKEEADEDGETLVEDDPELAKSLNKERRRAMLRAKGRRTAGSSRNSYKDKGGKSSQNSKIQKQQMSGW
uniref:non-specific serine/threonine protein kinase n=1 Tax=Kalanchoe fedtschenkoi TaxID=63787 RepID=A0A7N0TQM3_KALFE